MQDRSHNVNNNDMCKDGMTIITGEECLLNRYFLTEDYLTERGKRSRYTYSRFHPSRRDSLRHRRTSTPG